ncbi:hypothetical protein [Halorientalis litorea]|jgi:hypothetical protein|uniref:hypothetical protein n=1 Tax=Halorientalis litorea TaxID=2931977 RepID=UPI001FF5A611|nr:hypothetical protein [Halorientalis litorea]
MATDSTSAESGDATRVRGGGFSTLELAVFALVGITALTHLYAGVVEGAPPVLLAGVGFVGGLLLYVRGTRRRLLTAAAIPYTAVQIPLWYVVKQGSFTTVGYLDKAVQLLLVVLLVVLVVRQRQS